jgi:hypothetical protein
MPRPRRAGATRDASTRSKSARCRPAASNSPDQSGDTADGDRSVPGATMVVRRWRLPSRSSRTMAPASVGGGSTDVGRCIIDQGVTHHSLSRYQNLINPRRPLSARRHCPADPSRRRNAATSGSNSKPAAQSRVAPERPARPRICAARTRRTSGDSSSRPARNGALRSLIAPTAAMPIARDARSAQATTGRSLPSVAASATICGEGVSPAARAAASASPPGSAAPTTRADGGRRAGSPSRQRTITRSTARSMSGRTLDGVGGAASAAERARSAALPGAKAAIPVNISNSTRPSA